MRTRVRLLAVLIMTIGVIALPSSAAAQRRDRQCLADFITQYLNAMMKHDPELLHTSSRVRFTEDTMQMTLGEGLWKTITGLRPYRQDFIDVREGIAGTHTVVEENGMPVLLALRLKVFGLALSEVETMVVRNRQEGILFQPDAFKTPNPGMAYIPRTSELNSREEMIRIASLYPAGLRAGSFLNPGVPMSDVAYRFENGQKMAGPGCTFRPPSCENMKAQAVPKLPGLDETADVLTQSVWFGAGARCRRPGRRDCRGARRLRSGGHAPRSRRQARGQPGLHGASGISLPATTRAGAILLEAGRPAEAETVYWEDLRRNRENGWALFGLLQALRAQSKTAEAALTETRFKKAWARADPTLTASRFGRPARTTPSAP